MENLSNIMLPILTFIGGLLVDTILSSYLKSRGENFATKQDIEEITTKTESVKAKFEKDIDNYKLDLEIKMENLKLEQNQFMTNFELYTAMRHECYPELYKLVEVTNGAIRSLRGLSSEPTYSNVDKKDIQSYMKDRQLTEYDIGKILEKWDNERNAAIAMLRKSLESIDYKIAEESFHDARNYFLTMSLYLSEDIEDIGKTFFDKIHKLWFNYNPIFGADNGLSTLDENKLKEEIDSLKDEMKLKMKDELMPN